MNLFNRDRRKFFNIHTQYIGNVFDIDKYFINHPYPEIAQLYITLTTSPYSLSENWAEKHHIKTRTERENLKKTIFDALHYLKLKNILKRLDENAQVILKINSDGGFIAPYMEKQQQLLQIKVELCKALNIDVLK